MASNNYSIAPNFPLGVLPEQLVRELRTVWPVDVFPVSTIHRGKPGLGGILTAGNLQIETNRALLAQEDSDALAHFATHVPVVGADNGMNAVSLTAGNFNGETVFVLDGARQGGAGLGIPCYWDGRDRTWRRVSDDATIAVIP